MEHFQLNENGKNMKQKFRMCSSIFIHVFSETVARVDLYLNSSGKSDIYVMKIFKFSADTV